MFYVILFQESTLFSSSGEFEDLELVLSNESDYENKATPAETKRIPRRRTSTQPTKRKPRTTKTTCPPKRRHQAVSSFTFENTFRFLFTYIFLFLYIFLLSFI